MVWIHGGGGFSGNIWTALGPSLAPKGVVVVSYPFRIGAPAWFDSRRIHKLSLFLLNGLLETF
jgi:carboxylesterase type B